MARSRNIKPQITKNHKLAQLPFETRLLFSHLPMFADHKGLLEDIPEKIHVEIFPYDHQLDINNMLQQLHNSRFIDRYQTRSRPGQDSTQTRFIRVSNFLKHQNPHKKERDNESKYPDYDEKMRIPDPDPENPGQDPVETGANPADSLILIPDSGVLSPESSPADPHFKKQKQEPDLELIDRLTNLAIEKYKNQYAHEVRPFIINLLAQIDSETIEKAILNAAAAGNQDHEYRKDFGNLFISGSAVTEMAKDRKIPPQIDSKRPLRPEDENWA